MPGAGIEPAQPQGPRDFKSLLLNFRMFHDISDNRHNSLDIINTYMYTVAIMKLRETLSFTGKSGNIVGTNLKGHLTKGLNYGREMEENEPHGA